MLTSIIILTVNKLDFTKQCIESIRAFTTTGTYELIVVDNASSDGTVDWLKEQQDITSIYNEENQGFPKGCNQGIQVAKGDSILLLNNDVIVTPNWLANLQHCLYRFEDIGGVGPVTNACSNGQAIEVQYENAQELFLFSKVFNLSDASKWELRPRLVGFCLLMKKSVLDQVGLLDERFSPGNYEDDDICLRIRRGGYRLVLCRDTFIHHFGSASFLENRQKYGELLTENKRKFEEKWGTLAHEFYHTVGSLKETVYQVDKVKGNQVNENEVDKNEVDKNGVNE